MTAPVMVPVMQAESKRTGKTVANTSILLQLLLLLLLPLLLLLLLYTEQAPCQTRSHVILAADRSAGQEQKACVPFGRQVVRSC